MKHLTLGSFILLALSASAVAGQATAELGLERQARMETALASSTSSPKLFVVTLTTNIEKAKGFYGGVLGWKFQPSNMKNFWYADMGLADGIKGGFQVVAKLDTQGEQRVVNYVKVKNIVHLMVETEVHGGRILMKPTGLPDGGYIAEIQDTDKNTIGLYADDLE